MSLLFINTNNFKREREIEPVNNEEHSKRTKSDNKQVIHDFQRYWWKASNKDGSNRYVCVYKGTKSCPASITITKENTLLRCAAFHNNHLPMTEAEVKIYKAEQELKEQVNILNNLLIE